MAEITVEKARELLAPFLEKNPLSKIEPRSEDDATPIIRLPWGDENFDLGLPNDQAYFDALNNLFLPPRFKAMWHADKRAFEVFFTALSLPDAYDDVLKRKFSFAFRGKTFECEFARSSDELLKLAYYAERVDMPLGEDRNLWSFRHYARSEKGEADAIKLENASPICFWIKGFDWDEDLAVDLAMHLNFFMTFYDKLNPTIDVLPPKQEKSELKRRERYITGYFPEQIVGREINSNLLHFWAGTRKDDPLRRFQYAYQIVEHVSFYYVEERVKKSLHRALSSPHVYHELESVITEIMDHVSTTKTWEGNKMRDLLREAVDPKLLWREIERNKIYFCTDQFFEGGFRFSSWIDATSTFDTWSKNWFDTFTNRFREIRNSISHGREQSTSGVILPTDSNFNRILPWLDLASIAAGEVMLYRHTMI